MARWPTISSGRIAQKPVPIVIERIEPTEEETIAGDIGEFPAVAADDGFGIARPISA